jgi:hypothetical protein
VRHGARPRGARPAQEQHQHAADGDEQDGEDDEPEDRQVYVPIWVCIDPAAANLHYVHDLGREHSDTTSGLSDEQSAYAHDLASMLRSVGWRARLFPPNGTLARRIVEARDG